MDDFGNCELRGEGAEGIRLSVITPPPKLQVPGSLKIDAIYTIDLRAQWPLVSYRTKR